MAQALLSGLREAARAWSSRSGDGDAAAAHAALKAVNAAADAARPELEISEDGASVRSRESR